MSRFGFRKKIKQVLGMVEPSSEVTSPKYDNPHIQNDVPKESMLSTPNGEKKSSENNVVSESQKTQPKPEQDEKILKHRRRTKIALLKLTLKTDGTASLGDLHDLAERRYFIAHKAFSDLMEEMVAEELFLYDWSAGIARITELGKEWIQTDAAGGSK